MYTRIENKVTELIKARVFWKWSQCKDSSRQHSEFFSLSSLVKPKPITLLVYYNLFSLSESWILHHHTLTRLNHQTFTRLAASVRSEYLSYKNRSSRCFLVFLLCVSRSPHVHVTACYLLALQSPLHPHSGSLFRIKHLYRGSREYSARRKEVITFVYLFELLLKYFSRIHRRLVPAGQRGTLDQIYGCVLFVTQLYLYSMLRQAETPSDCADVGPFTGTLSVNHHSVLGIHFNEWGTTLIVFFFFSIAYYLLCKNSWLSIAVHFPGVFAFIDRTAGQEMWGAERGGGHAAESSPGVELGVTDTRTYGFMCANRHPNCSLFIFLVLSKSRGSFLSCLKLWVSTIFSLLTK